MLIIFEAVAITLWLTKDNIFYLFNFSYIGLSISLGIFLFIKKYKHVRRIVQLLVGLYMLIYLGLICNENMQIEGFWYYLFTGVFEAATIHYAVAKIFGPLLFGRGWCGYACWTAMILDFLPYTSPSQPRNKLGWIKYITFTVSLVFVASLFLANVGNIERIMFWAFIVGNLAYYTVGIALAFAFKDNRAFCKYICPITVFLKPMSYFSVLRIKCDKECEQKEVDILPVLSSQTEAVAILGHTRPHALKTQRNMLTHDTRSHGIDVQYLIGARIS